MLSEVENVQVTSATPGSEQRPSSSSRRTLLLISATPSLSTFSIPTLIRSRCLSSVPLEFVGIGRLSGCFVCAATFFCVFFSPVSCFLRFLQHSFALFFSMTHLPSFECFSRFFLPPCSYCSERTLVYSTFCLGCFSSGLFKI